MTDDYDRPMPHREDFDDPNCVVCVSWREEVETDE